MIEEQVAQLTGKIVWIADNTKLRAMQAALQRVSQQMQSVGKQADALSLKLGKKLGIKVDPAAQNKLSTSVAKNLDREAKAEIVVQKLRRQTFQAELAGQKLLFAGKKEAEYLTTADVRHQQALAVLASKQQKTTLDSLKVRGQEIKNTDLLTQAKQKQTRGELIHQQIIQRTANLKAKEIKDMTGIQKIQLAMNNAAENGRRAALKFTQQQTKSRVNDQRQTERFQMSQQRFKWQEARQQQWVANQNKPQPRSLLGLSGAPLVLTGVTAGLAGVVAAVSALQERIQARQDGASEAQNFNNALNTAGGKSVDNQAIARRGYMDISERFGTPVSLEGVQDYAKFIQGQLALGKSLTQAIKVYSDQSATFRAAALSGEAQKRAAYQLSQIRSKGRPEGSDVNDLGDALGGPVMSAIRAAAVDRLHANVKPEDQAGWFKAQVTAGAILSKDFDQGMTNFLKANQDILAKQMQSIDASQTRADNQKYLNEVGLNSDIELTQAVQDNIKAHQDLNTAMQPALTAFRDLDTVLTKLQASFLRFLIGKNPDGTDITTTDAAKRVDALSPDKAAIDTTALNGQPVDGKPSSLQDPVDRLWKKWFGQPDVQQNPDAPTIDPSDVTGQWLPLIRNIQPMTAKDVQKMNDAQKSNQTLPGKGDNATSTPAEPQTVNTDNSVHNVTTVESPNISIAITAPAGLDERQVALLARKEIEMSFKKYMPAEVQ